MKLNKLDIVKIDDVALQKLIGIFGQHRESVFHQLENNFYIFTGDFESDLEVEFIANLKDVWIEWDAMR